MSSASSRRNASASSDSSRASSRGRDDDNGRPTIAAESPEPQSNALVRVAMEMEAPEGKPHILALVIHGSTQGVKQFFEDHQASSTQLHDILSYEAYQHEEHRGSLLHVAAFCHHRHVMRLLVQQTVMHLGNATAVRMTTPVVFSLVQRGRFSTALFLLKLSPMAARELVDVQRRDTLLHCICRLPYPPFWFVEAVLQLLSSTSVEAPHQHATAEGGAPSPLSAMSASETTAASSSTALVVTADSSTTANTSTVSGALHRRKRATHATVVASGINDRNANGFTALHLAAMVLKGAAGREVVRLMLKYGADETMLTAAGKTCAEICRNGYIREELALTAAHRRGHQPPLDSDMKAVIDACGTSDKFPPLPDIVKEPDVPTTKPADEADDEAGDDDGGSAGRRRRPDVPLTTEEQDALVSRLFDVSLKTKSNWFAEKYSELEEQDKKVFHSKVLSAEDLEASVARLFQESMDHAAEVATALATKYIPERTGGPVLEREDLEACCDRLTKGALERLAASTQQLTERYAPTRAAKKLSKARMEASAMRLWKESQAKTAAEMSKLFETYACPPKGRFNGGTGPLSPERVKVLADRLSKKA